ncbi:DUF4434 domain-containing protein [Paenibacillus sp. L3-i20]|uniref:DUF4434 domain-containing protein n=1 Tax=Paenibacillus sp. L3-i20 TaxID=2905833 RepID=UPI001EDD5FF4|nr:DUF4434 domain-containing protein [Paenibacillus sp. L3-i20]GKU77721.1 hypothetical protein L3i20_v221180 [Paenibacillus sp. L3-i20]
MRSALPSRKIHKNILMVLCIIVILTCVMPAASISANAVNLLAGSSYSSSVTSDVSYPDSGGKELTDGLTATPFLADQAWQGRFNQSSYTISVDLGSAKTFQQFDAGFYKYTGAGIQTPTQVSFNYSSDNVSFQKACSLGQQGESNDIARISYNCSSASPITARYVEMIVSSTSSTWSFLDEWRVMEALPISTGIVRLGGTFLQPQLADKWSQNDWQKEFQSMKEVGINHLILQWSADTKNGTSTYPTSVSGLVQNTSNDIIGQALQMGAQYGIDIYIGLQANDDWFKHYANNVSWLNEQASISEQLVGDLWSKYGSYSSFKGWYLSFEVDNWHLPTSVEWQRLTDFYNKVTSVADLITPGLPIMISPFFNVAGGMTPAGWESMWSYILSRANIDIVAVQDGVGANHANTAELASWFAATKNAIIASGSSTVLWANAENFDKNYNPMNMELMIANMRAVQPYVSHYTSFSFNHYMSPQTVNPVYYATYRNYLTTSIMDSTAPSVPADMTLTATDSTTVNLKWMTSIDNTGVAGYQILRNGNIVHTNYNAATSFTDKWLLPNTSYTYSVRAFDGAGNHSPMTTMLSVITPVDAYPNILSAGKSYTHSTPDNSSYPDSERIELTNGLHGSTDYGDGAWQGRNTSAPYSFVIDLGQSQSIREMKANFLQVESVYIFLPKEVRFSVSSDNSSFTDVGTVAKPAHSSNDLTHTYRLTNLSSINGRYIKVDVIPASEAWTFVDEIEARN